MADTADVLLRVWGGAQTDAVALARATGLVAKEGRDAMGTIALWFRTKADRRRACDAMEPVASRGLAWAKHSGPHTHRRTVATAKLAHEGRTWTVHVDYGYGFSPRLVRFIWNDGNWACDDNRSLEIRKVDPTFPEMGCGDEIELVSLDVVRTQ